VEEEEEEEEEGRRREGMDGRTMEGRGEGGTRILMKTSGGWRI
jgi:hypothetical protein